MLNKKILKRILNQITTTDIRLKLRFLKNKTGINFYPEIFYKKSHQLIFESIQRLFRESEPIDLLTVSADLKKNKNFEIIGGDFYLINLSQKVSSSAHIEYHSRIIQQKFIQRKLISISNKLELEEPIVG